MASRVLFYADEISRAHQLGVSAGTDDEPWSEKYQRRALVVYRRSLPDEYLASLGESFGAVAEDMRSVASSCDGSWAVVESYLSTAAVVLGELGPAPHEDLVSSEASTPGLMRFGELAQIVSPVGARRLSMHASEVADTAASRVLNVSLDEIEIADLLRRGLNRLDVAVKFEVSERTIYRRQTSFCAKLGAIDFSDALVTANDLGLFDVRDGNRSA